MSLVSNVATFATDRCRSRRAGQRSQPGADHHGDGELVGFDEGFVGTYLYATYPAPRGRTSLATAIVPHDASHECPDLSRRTGEGYSGIELTHGSATDRAVELHAEGEKTIDGATVSGLAALHRTRGGETELYFLRRGTRFRHGGVGFRSSDPVSLAIDREGGTLTTERQVSVRFEQPGLDRVELDGNRVTPTDEGAGDVEVTIPPGRHDVRFG